jgi:2-haloacid dehalogenase
MGTPSVIHAGTKAFVFDAYGTIFDVHSAVRLHAEAIGPDAARLSEVWRAKQLEYSWVLSLAERYERFSALTEKALDYALALYPAVDKSVKPLLLDAYRILAAYPDVRPALEALRARGLATAILSNGDPEMLDAAVSSAGLRSLVDPVLSVDGAKTFKTSPSAYRFALSKLLLGTHEIVFVSSNRWDVAGAKNAGFKPIWVNRAGNPNEYPDFAPLQVVKSLSEIASVKV